MKRIIIIISALIVVLNASAQISTGAIIDEVTVTDNVKKEITIETNIPALRIINGLSQGVATTQKFNLYCGKYNITLSADGYQTLNFALLIKPEDGNYFYFELKKNVVEEEKQIIPIQEVTPEVVEQPQPQVYYPEWTQFIMLDYTIGGPSEGVTNSLGIRYGMQKRVGWYIAANISLQGAHYGGTEWLNAYNTLEKDMICSDLYGKGNNSISRNKFSIFAGANFWLKNQKVPFYLYSGIGYGYQSVLYVTKDKIVFPKNNDICSVGHGVAWEAGFQGRTTKGFTFRFGYALVGNRSYCYHEFSAGLGYSFKVK